MKCSANAHEAVTAADRATGNGREHGHLEIEADKDNGQLRIRAHGKLHAVEITLPAEVETPGSALIEAKSLKGALARESGPVHFSRVGKRLRVRCGSTKLSVKSYVGYHGAASRLDKDWGSELLLDGARLSAGLKATHPYAAKKGGRATLEGVSLVPSQGTIFLLAADNRAICEVPIGAYEDGAPFGGFLIPSPTVPILAGLMNAGPVRASQKDDKVLFSMGITSRIATSIIHGGENLREGVEKAWQRESEELCISRASLSAAIAKSIAFLKDEDTLTMTDQFVADAITFEGSTISVRGFEKDLDLEVDLLSAPLAEAFKIAPGYLKSAISGSKSDSIKLMKTPFSVQVQDADAKYLIPLIV